MALSKQQIFELYVLQSRNVRKLAKFRKRLKRQLNTALRTGNDQDLEDFTRLYALLYSAWSEAQYLQILHTPDAFSSQEIEAVKATRTIIDHWKKMIEIAFTRAGNPATDPQLQARQALVHKLVVDYIEPLSKLRNKIAHGQWVVALNSKNTAENQATTKQLKALDFVRVDVTFEVHKGIGAIMRDLMQSPGVTLSRDFDKHYNSLKRIDQNAAKWTVESRRQELARRRQPRDRDGNPVVP